MANHWMPRTPLRGRILISGKLVLDSPAYFGNGDDAGLGDLQISLDALERVPHIPGSSLAGAMRSYLRERMVGYFKAESLGSKAVLLKVFGEMAEDATGSDSAMLFSDARARHAVGRRLPETELRDGVALDVRTRTAEDKKKFDIELLPAGAVFDMRFEVALPAVGETSVLMSAIQAALMGLEKGEIKVGARKTRGMGECHVTGWEVRKFDFSNRAQLRAWLQGADEPVIQGAHIADLLTAGPFQHDQRQPFEFLLECKLVDSVLIRSGLGTSAEPDVVHLKSARIDNMQANVLSGTSIAGAMRARSLRILNTLNPPDADNGLNWERVETVFGTRTRDRADKRPLIASKLVVHESEIVNGHDMVQNRIKIDRFTGGVYPGGLFSEQSVYGSEDGLTRVSLRWQLLADQPHMVGLLLLLVKDICTGDLPLGGESAIGRGRLEGMLIHITQGEQRWQLRQNGVSIVLLQGEKTGLQKFVDALIQEVEHVA